MTGLAFSVVYGGVIYCVCGCYLLCVGLLFTVCGIVIYCVWLSVFLTIGSSRAGLFFCK